jgi:hypothetical protein
MAAEIISSLEQKIEELEQRGSSSAEILYSLKVLLREVNAELRRVTP